MWSAAAPPPATALSLLSPEDTARAEAYVARAHGVSPAEAVEDLAALLSGEGLLAVVSLSPSCAPQAFY